MFSKKLATMILGLSAALLTGCEAEQTEKDMIAEAQFCMDEARDAASANACVSKISGLTSPQAYTLRCAAGFISAEVTSAKSLSTALDAMTSKGTNGTAMLSILDFSNKADIDATFNACKKSGQKGLALIGAMAKSATTIASITATNPSCTSDIDPIQCSADAISETIASLVQDLETGSPSPETIATATNIASAVQTVYVTTCTGASQSNSSICSDINQAAASAGIDISTETNLPAIAEALLKQWNKP